MKRLKTLEIGIDLDGVIANFAKKFSEHAQKLYGNRCPIIQHEKEILMWDWTKWYPVTDDEVHEIWTDICNTNNFWISLDVLDFEDFVYMRDTLLKLDRANIYFITTRVESVGMSVKNQSEYWLRYNGWKNPTVIVCKQKGEIARLLDLDFFIDDKTENLVEVKETHQKCQVYARDVPHNHNCDAILGFYDGYKRVYSVKEFVDDVLKYYNEIIDVK
jgi:uncharacterized HAD superfamily protein